MVVDEAAAWVAVDEAVLVATDASVWEEEAVEEVAEVVDDEDEL